MSVIAFLSMDTSALEDFFVYDEMLIPHFNAHGYEVETVAWRDESVDWNRFSHVIVRSPWDYQQDPDGFIACLERIEASQATLHNPLSLMKWNIEKTYLQSLESQGVPVVPTSWADSFSADWFVKQFEVFNTDELVIKPALSANADDTFRIHRGDVANYTAQLSELFHNRKLMVQPFLQSVTGEGEYSLFYFGGQYSHTLLKQPKAGDFRVQEEHGGRLSAFTPDAGMLSVCEAALNAMPDSYLYARVDLIRTDTGWAIMELELIEPSLYFNIDESSAARFVDVFVSRHGKG
ncbi:MAG: hypothetical protein VYE47_08815 [Pseudomonadota bacterium]|nr:hypothetical protein [Pseudomonadota bacterium]